MGVRLYDSNSTRLATDDGTMASRLAALRRVNDLDMKNEDVDILALKTKQKRQKQRKPVNNPGVDNNPK